MKPKIQIIGRPRTFWAILRPQGNLLTRHDGSPLLFSKKSSLITAFGYSYVPVEVYVREAA